MSEVQAGKPRVSYAQFVAQQQPKSEFTPFSVARVIARVIQDVEDNPELKQIGQSKGYILGALQKCYLGEKDARKLTRRLIYLAHPSRG